MSSAPRVYRQWPGKNRFRCCGFLVGGADEGGAIGTMFLILLPMGFFHGVLTPIMVEDDDWGIGPAIGQVIIFLWVFYCWFKTAYSDPGIVPRNERVLTDREMRIAMDKQHRVVEGGREYTLAFCTTCMIHRPPRASHCATCDNCVEKWDHHCPWMGTCIGKRNYGSFVGFLVGVPLLCLYVMAVCIAIVLDIPKLSPAELATCIALVVYCIIAAWPVTGLCCYHTGLVSNDVTTREKLKGLVSADENVVTVSHMFWNWVLLCTECHPQHVDFRARVRPRDTEGGGGGGGVSGEAAVETRTSSPSDAVLTSTQPSSSSSPAADTARGKTTTGSVAKKKAATTAVKEDAGSAAAKNLTKNTNGKVKKTKKASTDGGEGESEEEEEDGKKEKGEDGDGGGAHHGLTLKKAKDGGKSAVTEKKVQETETGGVEAGVTEGERDGRRQSGKGNAANGQEGKGRRGSLGSSSTGSSSFTESSSFNTTDMSSS